MKKTAAPKGSKPVKRKAQRKAAVTKKTPASLTDQLVASLDQVERSIQSLAGQFAQVDEDTKQTLGTDRLFRIERLAALADRSKAGSDAIAAPPHEQNLVAPTSQPPIARYVHGEPATTAVVQTAESEEAKRKSEGRA